eukprot:CAMPEP_0206454358 /NCGR_PEP_ID=MMETSP0324_2-20121206/21091_1 /ASSEMBLY_ACC=CAM_ASM_000836 /TAXON_ID=2866 /ORGANISM="Crypthecodinium cohnii, Strain Seligo" /LENGTH=78 /DNA_ID=CAMNT_0053924819 /DNA_START=438 /DNA_END=674 /DNA_ORIENTATION=+
MGGMESFGTRTASSTDSAPFRKHAASCQRKVWGHASSAMAQQLKSKRKPFRTRKGLAMTPNSSDFVAATTTTTTTTTL